MNHLTHAESTKAIIHLNRIYGKGDVRQVRYFLDGKIEVIANLQYGQSKFMARVKNRTVFCRGHQMTDPKTDEKEQTGLHFKSSHYQLKNYRNGNIENVHLIG